MLGQSSAKDAHGKAGSGVIALTAVYALGLVQLLAP